MRKYNWIKNTNQEEVFTKDKKFWNFLSKKAYPISKGKIRIPISLEPFVIEKDEYNKLNCNLKFFVSACIKLVDKYFENKKLQEIISLNKDEHKLIEKFNSDQWIGVIRVDMFYDQSPKIVEINSDYPDGFFMHDITAKAILTNLTNLKYLSLNHAKLFQKLLISTNVLKDKNIFIGYDKGRKFIDEFFLTKNKLQKFGWKNILIGHFEDLKYKNRGVYFSDKKIDIIRRGSELFRLRKIPDLIDGFYQTKSRLKIINNFKMRLLGYKSLMAALYDSRFQKYLSKKEINAVKILLPFTVKLDYYPLNNALKEKNQWVLKPIDLAEGENVCVGSSVNIEEWGGKLKSAMQNPKSWILQKKVSVPQTEFNWVDGKSGKIVSKIKKFDFNPHIILYKNSIEMGNILVRFSDSNILNVAKGGGLTYCFIEKKITGFKE